MSADDKQAEGVVALLKTRRFLPLFLTQFLGAFNDNVFKNALVVLLTFHAAHWTTMAPALLANLAAAIFILPFFVFSATAGQLADKFDKAQLARGVKLLEMAIMLVAGVGFWRQSLAWLFVALFLLGVHSSVFGPVKYALLPQHLKPAELMGGNALVEAGTFVAILLGTLAGGLLAGLGQPQWIAGFGLLIAALGYLASRAIPAAPAPAPDLVVNPNPLTETWRCIGYARESRVVFLAILGISWFWLFGALFLAQFPAYARDVLGGAESAVTLLLATFTLGVGIGSIVCEKFSSHRVELGLVPFGSIGLSVFALDLALASPGELPAAAPLALSALLAAPGVARILVDLALVGLFGGFFIVPLYALIQQRSAPDKRARIIAANNIVNALFMVAGALGAAALLGAGWTIPQLFVAAAVVNALVAVYIYTLVPEFLLRFAVWGLMHTVGRVRLRGFDALPAEGAALIWFDPARFGSARFGPTRSNTGGEMRRSDLLKLLAASDRPLRFVLDTPRLYSGVFGRLMRECKAIPAFVDSDAALAQARAALADGQRVLTASPAFFDDLAGTAPRFEMQLRHSGGSGVGTLFTPSLLVLSRCV